MSERLKRCIPVAMIALFGAACQTTPEGPEKQNLSSAEITTQRQEIKDMSSRALDRLYAENSAVRAEIKAAVGYGVFDVNTMNAILLVGARGKGVIVDNKTGQQTFMRAVRAGTGPGVGYQRLSQIFVFKSEAALSQFKLGNAAGGDVSASVTAGTAATQYSFNPYITVYQLSEKGFALQANWGGTAYFVDPDLNN